jgi:pimeloyl-ACP methyl ester carboxylesterase
VTADAGGPDNRQVSERIRVERDGLTFDVYAGGPIDGAPVLLLHGFPQDHREWDLVAPLLQAEGLRTYAVDQRGYSPGARPAGVAAYRIGEVVADAVAVLDEIRAPAAHVVGHDWGAIAAWFLAGRHPERVATLTAISIPHPAAVPEVMWRHPTQALRLSYFLLFRRRGLAERLLLARYGAPLRRMMDGIDPERARAYATAMREPGRLTGALGWYRAASRHDAAGLGPIDVPTTFVWSTRELAAGKHTAARCGAHVRADYRFVRLDGLTHWLPEEAPAAIAGAVLARCRS